jgi:hypothetical protein
MRKVSVALVLAAAACGGGDSTTPTASGVFPAEGFTGRTLRVEVSGDATTWKDGATVDFGTGVTVTSVNVASPTDLFADITVDPMAAPGKNDVTVTSGSKKYTLTKAFELVSPIKLSYSGDVDQYGVPNFTINNLDFETPFDITTDPASGAYTNLVISSPAGTEFIISAATQYQLSGQVFIDANGMAGPVSIVSGPSGGTSNVTSVGDTINVMPRTPTAFTGTATGMFAAVGDSSVYSVTASGNSILHYTLGTTDTSAQLASAILGSGGTWRNDFLGAGHALISSTVSVVVVNFGGSGYSYTLAGAAEAVTATPEGTDTTQNVQTAKTAAIPYELSPATLSAANDKDVYKVTVAGANKKLHIVTDLGNANTDTAVDVTDCTTGMTSYTDGGTGGTTGAGPIDGTECNFLSCTNLGEDVKTLPLAAGTYCISISAGQGFDPTNKDYKAVWWLE